MTKPACFSACVRGRNPVHRAAADQGFSLVEFMLSSLILMVVAGSVFSLLGRTERTASYQSEIQNVLGNTRLGMETLQKVITQAGNDPLGAGFQGVTIVSATEVNIRADLTGSMAGNPDKGDPDGDTVDAWENVTIRYNAGNSTIELVSGGVAQPLVGNISAFSLQYFDQTGAATGAGADVRRINVTMTCTSPVPDPQTGKVFSVRLSSDVHLANRE
jgi:Tfp pilus assembly protein PilV